MLLIRLMVRDRTAPKGHPKMWSLEPQSAVRRPADLVLYPHSISWWSAHGAIQARMRVSQPSAMQALKEMNIKFPDKFT